MSQLQTSEAQASEAQTSEVQASEAAEPVGVALAGGASRRLGRDKAAIEARELGLEHPGDLLDWTVARLASLCSEVLVAGGNRPPRPGALSVTDGPGAGPAAGILGAAARRPGRRLLVLACDMPRVPESLLKLLLGLQGDLVIPESSSALDPGKRRLEPLCAVFSPLTLKLLAGRVDQGRLDLHGLAEAAGHRVRFVGPDEYRELGEPGQLFLNVNRPDDLAALRQCLLRRRSTRQ